MPQDYDLMGSDRIYRGIWNQGFLFFLFLLSESALLLRSCDSTLGIVVMGSEIEEKRILSPLIVDQISLD
jgi:hypothetical protein